MNNEQEEAYSESLRLLLVRALEWIKQEQKRIPAEQSAKGELRSGNTIKRLMTSIHESHAKLYVEAINAAKKSFPSYSPSILDTIIEAVDTILTQFENKVTNDFDKSCEAFGRKGIFERIEEDFKGEFITNRAEFRNDLQNYLIQFKNNEEKGRAPKVLIWIEVILLVAMALVAGMWFKDPEGNYEPLLIILGLPLSAIAVILKIRTKNT